MTKFSIVLAGLGAVLAVAPAVAQGSAELDQRIAEIGARLDTGLRSGSLTGPEHRALRNRLQAVMQLKARYAADGISGQEAEQLRQKLSAIEAGVKRQAGDAQKVETKPVDSFAEIDRRLESLKQRIDAGAAEKQLTPAETQALRDRLSATTRVVERYRADNMLSPDERRDVNTRLAALSAGTARQRHDAQGMR